MSSDLIWLITRDQSSFLLKNQFATFAREPGNLTGKNALKYSGLANAKVVDVSAGAEGVVVSTKGAKNASSPAKAVRALTIKKGSRSANVSAQKILAKYRPDLTPVSNLFFTNHSLEFLEIWSL